MFHAADLDRNGFWSQQEFRALQRFRYGRAVSTKEADEHFLNLCTNVGADPNLGLDLAAIMRVSDDASWPPSDDPSVFGYFLDAEEIKEYLRKWSARK